MPEPSPITKPSRSLSNGRDACSGASLRLDTALMLENPAIANSVTAASAPPVIIMSAAPRWTRRYDSPRAWAEEEHADTVQ